MQVLAPAVLVNVPVDELHTTIPAVPFKGAGKLIIVVTLAVTLIGAHIRFVSAPSLGTAAALIIMMYSEAVSVTTRLARAPLGVALMTWLASTAAETFGTDGAPETRVFCPWPLAAAAINEIKVSSFVFIFLTMSDAAPALRCRVILKRYAAIRR